MTTKEKVIKEKYDGIIPNCKNALNKARKQRDIGAWYGTLKNNTIDFQIINGNAIEPATTEDEYVLKKKKLLKDLTNILLLAKMSNFYTCLKKNLNQKNLVKI
jgi:hypothetical protein